MTSKRDMDPWPDGHDVNASRKLRYWSTREVLLRIAWEYIGSPIFRITPRPLWEVRVALLRLFGGVVGKGVHICPSVRIAIPWNLHIGDLSAVGEYTTLYSLGKIRVGLRATISQGSHLCAGTHDYTELDFPLRKADIVIGNGAWICADAFIGPDVTIGDLAIVGARAVVMRDVMPSAIVVGNPARRVGTRVSFKSRDDDNCGPT